MTQTFNDIIEAAKNVLEDDSLEFEEYVPVAIQMAERRLMKELNQTNMVQITTTTVSANSFLVGKPSSYRVGFDFSFVDSSGENIVLTKKTDDFIRDYWPISSAGGSPKYYADYDKNNFIVAPAPSSTTVFRTKFIAPTNDFAPLSLSNQTNYFTDEHNELLFFAVMSQMCQFIKDPETVGYWENQYSNALIGSDAEGKRYRRDDGLRPNNPDGGQNTLTGGA